MANESASPECQRWRRVSLLIAGAGLTLCFLANLLRAVSRSALPHYLFPLGLLLMLSGLVAFLLAPGRHSGLVSGAGRKVSVGGRSLMQPLVGHGVLVFTLRILSIVALVFGTISLYQWWTSLEVRFLFRYGTRPRGWMTQWGWLLLRLSSTFLYVVVGALLWSMGGYVVQTRARLEQMHTLMRRIEADLKWLRHSERPTTKSVSSVNDSLAGERGKSAN